MPRLMKGHKWLERKDKLRRNKSPVVTYPVYAEIKYDEIRCHVIACGGCVQFLSYAEKPLANMERFGELFTELSAMSGYNEFDCGFLVNDSFDASYRWVRSTNGLPADLLEACTSFILFDLPESGLAYKRRKEVVAHVASLGGLEVPDYRLCFAGEDVQQYFEYALDRGFEGLMIKSPDHLYEPGKRTDGWLKYKPSEDADGIAVGFEEAVCGKDQPELGLAKGDLLGRIGSVELAMADGSRVAPSGIPHALGEELLAHPENYIGKTVEFNFMERDRQGGYRHPTFKRFREETV